MAVLMPGSDETDAAQLASRIHRALVFRSRTTTVSIGVAQLDEPNAPALLRAADEALYGAKHAGRNRTRCSTAPNEPSPHAERKETPCPTSSDCLPWTPHS